MLHVIKQAVPEKEHRLRLRFADGCEGILDLTELINKNGVYTKLRDDDAFARVRVGPNGRWVEWPQDIDLCADALYKLLQSNIEQQSTT